MKLKYYLRGLGIGLIITTIILTISHNIKGPSLVSDDKDTQQETTGSIIAYTKEVKTETTQNSSQTETGSQKETATQTETGSQIEESSQATSSSQIESKSDASPIDTKPTTDTKTESAEEGNTVILTISLGDYSNKISQMLYELGAIDDKEAFDNYLSEEGYSRQLKVGVYKITIGDTYENIAKIITQTN